MARHKARLLAKEYNQWEWVDFIDTFSLVAKLVTIKMLLALVASQKWHLAHLYINNAFMNGYLFEEVYMELPLGNKPHQVLVSSSVKLVSKLQKSIYGLKQAWRQWNIKFTEAVVLCRFQQSKSDYSLFTNGSPNNFFILFVGFDSQKKTSSCYMHLMYITATSTFSVVTVTFSSFFMINCNGRRHLRWIATIYDD